MKPESQRIAIAEACGIKPPFNVKQEGKWRVKKTIWTIPDYLSDLNAMHEAEKVLTDEQQGKYAGHLAAMTFPKWMLHATAAQRAEAFLRTIGKWKDAE